MNQTKYPTDCFSDLYHSRWGIEELYKISKTFIDVEDFHSQTLRTVKQELYGHLLLINISRMFEHNSNNMITSVQISNSVDKVTEENSSINKNRFKVNFKNCISVVGRHLENLILAGKQLIMTWLYQTMKTVAKLRQRIRPNRTYSRVSFKPRNSWTSFGKSAKVI